MNCRWKIIMKEESIIINPPGCLRQRAPLAIHPPLADSLKGGLRCAALVIPAKAGIQLIKTYVAGFLLLQE